MTDLTEHNHFRPDDRKVAAAAYDAGLPSLLPENNVYKRLVEEHRWGYHNDDRHPDLPPNTGKACPICDRGTDHLGNWLGSPQHRLSCEQAEV